MNVVNDCEKEKKELKNIEYEVRCNCCGKVFKTEDPKQDTCTECLIELAEFLSVE